MRCFLNLPLPASTGNILRPFVLKPLISGAFLSGVGFRSTAPRKIIGVVGQPAQEF